LKQQCGQVFHAEADIAAEFGVATDDSQSSQSEPFVDIMAPLSISTTRNDDHGINSNDTLNTAAKLPAAEALNPLFEPAPPYTSTVNSPGLLVINNFYFMATQSVTGPQATQIPSMFSPALTVGLLLLNIPQSRWPEIQKCIEYIYAEHMWPDILMLCSVPDNHILYIVGLIHAKNAVTVA